MQITHINDNPFLSDHSISYFDCLNMISDKELLEGLLGYGLFGDKLPPVFQSDTFMSHWLNKLKDQEPGKHDWIRYKYKRNIGIFREFGLPNPFAYAKLVNHCSDNWADLLSFFQEHTLNQVYKISRIHLRKLKNSSSIFEMNYKNWKVDPNPATDLMVNAQYRVKCDISRCFPSIYTHALDWALIGKERAKKNSHGDQCMWSHLVDQLTSNLTNGQTHGILIGPHISNLLSEIILIRIDEKLSNEGFDFIRFIDDYICYTQDIEHAERFVIALSDYLSEYDLAINQKKTLVQKLPQTTDESWINALSSHTFQTEDSKITATGLRNFLDLATICFEQNENDAAILNYALKMLKDKPLKYGAQRYLARAGSNLLYLYPYLYPIAEEYIFKPAQIKETELAFVCNNLFYKSYNERDYLSCCYSLYFATKSNFLLNGDIEQCAIKSCDCLLMLFTWIYAKQNNLVDIVDKMHDHAKSLYSNSDMDRFWIFIYESFDLNDFNPSDNMWRSIKKNGITFIKWKELSDNGIEPSAANN